MTDFKDILQTGAIIFAAGMAWMLVKTLRDNLVELKAAHLKFADIVIGHETRITILEKVPKRRK